MERQFAQIAVRHPDIVQAKKEADRHSASAITKTLAASGIFAAVAAAFSFVVPKKGWFVRAIFAAVAAIGGAVIGGITGGLAFFKPALKEQENVFLKQNKVLKQEFAVAAAPAPALPDVQTTQHTAAVAPRDASHAAQAEKDAVQPATQAMSK